VGGPGAAKTKPHRLKPQSDSNGLAARNGPTGSFPGSDACGDPSGGGTGKARSTSHGSMKSEGALWMPWGSAIVSWTHQTVRRVPLASDRHYPAPPMAASRGVPGSGPGGRNPRPCAGGTARLWRPRRGIGPLERSRRSPGSGFLEATGI
jgi:hypothetical protein